MDSANAHETGLRCQSESKNESTRRTRVTSVDCRVTHLTHTRPTGTLPPPAAVRPAGAARGARRAALARGHHRAAARQRRARELAARHAAVATEAATADVADDDLDGVVVDAAAVKARCRQADRPDLSNRKHCTKV